ncbi:cytochrome ubiquinol oxidase subunit I [Bailinhaonella thermotolerans]|uniref:Cytochrome ubiquinol oxidase subunit I n=1 Tax=Bailinhaonella thermotolerans TaxID=1070861 RepID=A0A3A4ARZ8_9ACTN|nr:cytochrome ubiquinol oxidase subunit I [Bailinhaonella thermotolerans]RJL32648.1 cytochrome ubiquinol oxidase subunit I [Bailinhaonella thermotolerans]
MNGETLELARWQFALTAGTHFLFVALTLGLATLVACVQTWATLTRNPVHARMTRFWGQLYVINYAVGIVTGLVMELQIGLNWSGLTHFAGNVFGSALAMETLVAFFIESTFLGLWIFGWNRLNRWAHLTLIWIVTLTAYASAYWIMVSNGFLQNPVGYRLDGKSLVLTDVGAVLANPNSILAFFHILGGALVTASFFMAGVSAYHLRRGHADSEGFRRSLRIGVGVSLPALMFTVTLGGMQFDIPGQSEQAFKSAAFGGSAEEVARVQADLVARFGPGDYLPPAALVDGAATLMMAAWAVMMLISGLSVLLMSFRRVVSRLRVWHWLLMLAIPLPFVSMISGWVYREVGRQPWAVNELLLVRDAVSDLSPGTMRLSITAFGVVFAALVVLNYWLLARQARRGPEGVALGAPTAPDERPAPAAVTF